VGESQLVRYRVTAELTPDARGPPSPPSLIVCLTEETVETLYLLGEQDRLVGVSGYAVRPPQVRREKPLVSAFTSADIPKILALEPDLVFTFSDLQAEIAAELIPFDVAVHAFNQRKSTNFVIDEVGLDNWRFAGKLSSEWRKQSEENEADDRRQIRLRTTE
jgi:ABC-type Fe3+-hydroxamate transport system substrate-binding protein